MLKTNTTWFTIYHPHYKGKSGITEFIYNSFLFRPPLKLLLLLGILSYYIIKVIVIYHLYYKDKLVDNPTQSFVYVANSLHFLYNWRNLLTTSLFTYNNVYITKLSLVIKIKELPRTFLYLISCPLQALFLFNLILSKYTIMSKW